MAKTQIPEIKYSEIAPTRAWLVAKYLTRVTKFAFPPFQGTHQECYQTIVEDKELAPARGLDLALLTNGAYTQDTPQWLSVRDNFRNSLVRVPNRILLIPRGHIKEDRALSGVLVERDIQGNGLSTKMQVPDLSKWTQNSEGVYVPNAQDYKFVFYPSDLYDGKSFEEDRVAHAHLTPEGAEIFAKTAKDAGLVPYDYLAQRVKEISSPEQRVSLLYEGSGRLRLGGHSWGDDRDGHAFGVFLSH